MTILKFVLILEYEFSHSLNRPMNRIVSTIYRYTYGFDPN